MSELATIRGDIAYEERRFEQAARAPYDGRLADADALAEAQRVRRQRISELRVQEAVALEESAAELRETFDSAFSGVPRG